GKTSPAAGPMLDLAGLSFPALTRPRTATLKALIDLCAKDPNAAAVLGLGPTQANEVRVNTHLRKAPCAPAIEIYTGVLFDALDVRSLGKPARRRLQASTVISSALFGLVRPDDLIPAYRLSGDVSLPGTGAPSARWRDAVGEIITQSTGVIIDLRSQMYANLGPIPAEAAQRAVSARILLEKNGKRSIVSHHNKASKGRLVRALADRSAQPKSIDSLMKALKELSWKCELSESKKSGQPATLDIIVPEI
ncbi:MAG: YaaA family protein, partial [Candidatus Nanopelagicales bacterium]